MIGWTIECGAVDGIKISRGNPTPLPESCMSCNGVKPRLNRMKYSARHWCRCNIFLASVCFNMCIFQKDCTVALMCVHLLIYTHTIYLLLLSCMYIC